jgi:hypothetical protein
VQIIGNPIKMYLSSNPDPAKASLPTIQFGSMLHNTLPITKKVHMQNISHVPIRIDWIVYDLDEETVEQPKLIELISVIDGNPFDPFNNDENIPVCPNGSLSERSLTTSMDRRHYL